MCLDCGAPLTTRHEIHRFSECGLPRVTLMGIEVSRCPACGYYEVAIPHVEQLHDFMASRVIDKSTRLTGREVRFLRKSLGLSGSDFARRMGVTVETVSRWENDAASIGAQADRLLRLLVAQGRLKSRYPLERMDAIDADHADPTPMKLKLEGDRWAEAESPGAPSTSSRLRPASPSRRGRANSAGSTPSSTR
ncbi:MAG TPA: type II TA system antitoxin MqsA family protein [Candidatus Eisenbacteria bacterium]|nr:type II TA system antitoxin MqsA family protein [Candidatus Eisenbacteria bacterium]